MACQLKPGAEDWFNSLDDATKLSVIKFVFIAEMFICKVCALNQAFEFFQQDRAAERTRESARYN